MPIREKASFLHSLRYRYVRARTQCAPFKSLTKAFRLRANLTIQRQSRVVQIGCEHVRNLTRQPRCWTVQLYSLHAQPYVSLGSASHSILPFKHSIAWRSLTPSYTSSPSSSASVVETLVKQISGRGGSQYAMNTPVTLRMEGAHAVKITDVSIDAVTPRSDAKPNESLTW